MDLKPTALLSFTRFCSSSSISCFGFFYLQGTLPFLRYLERLLFYNGSQPFYSSQGILSTFPKSYNHSVSVVTFTNSTHVSVLVLVSPFFRLHNLHRSTLFFNQNYLRQNRSKYGLSSLTLFPNVRSTTVHWDPLYSSLTPLTLSLHSLQLSPT